VKAVIIACNTASIAGLEAAQKTLPQIPIYGMVTVGVRGALRATRNQRIGIWGTESTIANNAQHDMLEGRPRYQGQRRCAIRITSVG